MFPCPVVEESVDFKTKLFSNFLFTIKHSYGSVVKFPSNVRWCELFLAGAVGGAVVTRRFFSILDKFLCIGELVVEVVFDSVDPQFVAISLVEFGELLSLQ